MKMTQLIFPLGDLLHECELKLLASQSNHAAAVLCCNLAGAISSSTYIGALGREKAATGFANAICPLHDDGLADTLILPALKEANLVGLYGRLVVSMRQIRLALIVEQYSGIEVISSQVFTCLRHFHPDAFAEGSELVKPTHLNSLIDDWLVQIGKGMKTASIDTKIKFLLGLGLRPDVIYQHFHKELQ